jgi:hypothetical protein
VILHARTPEAPATASTENLWNSFRVLGTYFPYRLMLSICAARSLLSAFLLTENNGFIFPLISLAPGSPPTG